VVGFVRISTVIQRSAGCDHGASDFLVEVFGDRETTPDRRSAYRGAVGTPREVELVVEEN